jgi:hypothetical protein
VLAFLFRKLIQDRIRIVLREKTPTMPDAATARAFEAMGVTVPAGAADPLEPLATG